jgi:hypothetical protein
MQYTALLVSLLAATATVVEANRNGPGRGNGRGRGNGPNRGNGPWWWDNNPAFQVSTRFSNPVHIANNVKDMRANLHHRVVCSEQSSHSAALGSHSALRQGMQARYISANDVAT